MRRHLKETILVLTMAVLWFASPSEAVVPDSETCLGCHGEGGAVGSDLVIDSLRFDHTSHGELGCPACHESVTENHPDDGLAPSRAVCGDCHQDIAEEYARTAHSLNAACGDCHNPHAALGSREVSGHDMNRQCGLCHGPEEMASAHGAWLPQSRLHLEMLPCISCHTGSRNYVITLYLIRTGNGPQESGPDENGPFELAGYGELQNLAGDRDIQTLVDADGDNFVTLAELKKFNGSSESHALRLKGMFMPEVVTHNLQILENRWNCTFCHASGPGAMQTSFLALPQEDGTYRQLLVEKGAILDALNGTPDFYMLGATRNASLDLIGLAILAGGLIMPVGHGTLRFLTRKNRQ